MRNRIEEKLKEEEIKLIADLEERGYVKGATVKCLYDNNVSELSGKPVIGLVNNIGIYYTFGDKILVNSETCDTLIKEGDTWAEIMSPPPKKTREEKYKDLKKDYSPPVSPETAKEQYFSFAKEFTNDMIQLSKKKNADYTGNTDDPFANFSSVESLGITTEQGFIVRMNDKLKRLASFVQTGTLQVKDESVTDTLQDLANYCVLFAGYLKSKED